MLPTSSIGCLRLLEKSPKLWQLDFEGEDPPDFNADLSGVLDEVY